MGDTTANRASPGEAVTVPAPGRTGTGINPHHPWHVVHQGYTVLVTNPDGTLRGREREGLWDYDTRILSTYRMTLDGREPQLVSSGMLESERWAAKLRVHRPGRGPAGPELPEDALEIGVTRRVGRGMVEGLLIYNHSMAPVEMELGIELDADFCDVQEIGRGRMQEGERTLSWDPETWTLLFDYHVEHDGRSLHRASRVRIIRARSEPARDGTTLQFRLELPPRGAWSATLGFHSLVDGEWREPLPGSPAGGTERDRVRERWRSGRARLQTGHPVLEPAFEQAAEDLFALRNWEYDQGPDAWFPKAGAPTYSGIFGRDSLTASWQSALLGPEQMRGALAIIAATQAGEDSAWRDEEPGKLIHEIRRGPLSELEIIPQRRYYGTQTTPAMFVLALSEYWHWTGDDSLLRRYRDVALRTFEWADRYGDRDGDGFLEYTQRSEKGLRNHAWKDSDEAIRYPDGTLVENPTATVEEQAYHFIALQRMAEILVALGEEARAGLFLNRARTLMRRWHEAFWVEEDGFYAMALDPEKRPVRSIGSNPGHALATGIVPAEQARAVADRLLAPDIFSGWGVRTLSSEHPSYNPFAYHLGTVWPVENATFALGFKRYGLDEHVERLASGLFAASAYFDRYRLPEALGGHGREESPIPCAYPKANSPQAWSASATVQLVQILLGLYPFAPARALAVVRPRLPSWVDAVTVRRIRVGDAVVSLRFERQEDGSTRLEVIEREGALLVATMPPPQDLRPEAESSTNRLKEWLLGHAPGRTAVAARIALGELEL